MVGVGTRSQCALRPPGYSRRTGVKAALARENSGNRHPEPIPRPHAQLGNSIVEEALRRGWEDFIGRPGGPMSFRLILQPAVAIMLAIRAGMRDARDGRPPFLWAVLSNQGRRQELIRQGWKDVGNVFIVALVLDSIYQVMVHSGIYALELLLAATILALVPYVAVRGLVTRLARRRSAASRADGRPGDRATPVGDPRPERQVD